MPPWAPGILFLCTLLSDMSYLEGGSFWSLLFEDPLLSSEPAWDDTQPVTAIIQLVYNPGPSFLGYLNSLLRTLASSSKLHVLGIFHAPET